MMKESERRERMTCHKEKSMANVIILHINWVYHCYHVIEVRENMNK